MFLLIYAMVNIKTVIL